MTDERFTFDQRMATLAQQRDRSTGPPSVERDDSNDYATYWQERSGFFHSAEDSNVDRPGDE